MASEIHINDVGLEFRITIKQQDGAVIDLSDADSIVMVFSKPNNETVEKTAQLYNGGTTGIINYVTVNGDLDVAGLWKLQAVISLNSGVYHSDLYRFKVHPNIG